MTAEAVLILAATVPTVAQTFESRFAETPDGVWTRPSYWARPLQNWRVSDGHLECMGNGSDRTLHLLTRQLTPQSDAEVSVKRPVLIVTDEESNELAYGFSRC